MQTQITHRFVIEEETEEQKNLFATLQMVIDPLEISWDIGLARDPPSLIYPLYLSPPSSYSNKASQNHVLSSSPDPAIHPIVSAKSWLLPMLPSSTKSSLDTLKRCGKCLGYQPLNGMEMKR